MASVGALGIGLSIVFGVFLVLLLAELYYLLFWKRKSLRVNSVSPNEPQPGAGAAGAGAGGAPDHPQQSGLVAKKLESRFIVGIDGECVLAPPRFLFTIKEESREDLVESDVDALKKAKLPPIDHVVVQVFDHLNPDDLRCDKPLLQLCSSSSEASSSSSCSSSARVSEDEELGEEEDEETIREDIDHHPPVSAASDKPADEEDVCTTPFLTPPSSPGFSTPSSSPLHITRRSSTSSSCYESPPSPPLAPMPVLGRSSSSSSTQEMAMSEMNSSPHFTPLSCSSRDSRQ